METATTYGSPSAGHGSTGGTACRTTRLVLDAEDEDLNRYFRVVADDLDVIWPGSDPRWAGLALLITHVDEVLRTSKTAPARLRIDERGRVTAD
ncbi:hypothetical protein [Cellulosimicrobium marinum]|uniref:hypothetical protein n=1 Tax=Cellulosimicrobium marinum TaxID=1638992 RepID=UPI001E2FF6D0|nr:hypothetical protein [Cellulosimicrobium marinum]MCB7134944.1 hypothetical protein [Cellulosimicrobium marinum]